MEKQMQAKILKKSSCWVCLVPPWGFKQKDDEQLYASYTQRQRQRAIPRLLVIGILLQVFAIFVPGERDLSEAYALVAIGLIVNLGVAAVYFFVEKSRPVISHVAWLVVWAQLLISVSRRVSETNNELLGWAVVVQYFTLATLPFHYLILIVYSVLSLVAYLLVQYYNVCSFESNPVEDFCLQQSANALLLIGGTVLGGAAFALGEWVQRRSFRDTKRSLRDKLTIEQQSKEQERLLLSVLPEHVAVQMRKDLGLIDTQFKKIYMSRHENVSILYADIVGFTAISSTYSAQDLVAILNELFARFDRLAEKYQQLRIKILGDCYYCISGAPVERPDHAVLCVHMGLSMVKAIKYVQQTTNSPVDMRVGIHTGAVLAGVLGQRQWQFDVYSRDVELANKMESSGMAGRVHISEATLSFLNDEFEVEPAHGERREEMLRQAGIKTYFIVRVLKPFQGGDDKNGDATGDGDDTLSDLRDDDEDSVLSPQDEHKDSEELKIHSMLQEELVNRDDDKELADATTLCLTFKSSEAEQAYALASGPCPLSVPAPPLLLLPALGNLLCFAVPLTWPIGTVYSVLLIEILVVNAVYCRFALDKKKSLSPYYNVAVGIFNIVVFVAATVAPLVICGFYEAAARDALEQGQAILDLPRCTHSSYYYHIGAGALCGALWVAPAGGWSRSGLLLLLALGHTAPLAVSPALLDWRPSPDRDPYVNPQVNDHPLFDILSRIHAVRHLLMLFLIVIALLIFNRYTEALKRARHSRGERMRAQAEQAADLRRRNQALIHNVLPPHVATHFMGAKHHHRDLYSQSYAEVGVLFASMPNFSEFYSEETVNNQGLECLRFLNEVISDFDLLLEDAKFSKDIIKIKTISSTYMAASGLNPTRQMQPSDGILVRWAHLACLVEFALQLQRVLAAINEQSFNHFVLKMGINHGPITAGVIGAKKPHYDIWGNTVNVASRMESTGKAGCIQVTEETCEILQKFGYYFEQRGLVAVKGKGQLMTYYLQGRRDVPSNVDDKPNIDDSTADPINDVPLANGTSPHSADIEAARPLLQQGE